MAIAYRSVLGTGGDGATTIVQSFTVTQQPTKTVYMEGEPLDLTGLRASAVVEPFSGEVTGYVTTTPADEQPVPAGISDILVKYGNAITSVPITVYGIEEIEITTQPTTTEYIVGDTLDLTGIVVTGYANNRTMSTDITSLCTFSPDTLSTSGTQTITVSYKNLTTTISVGVYQADTLTVTTLPTKKKYELNEVLDLTGIVVTASVSGASVSQDVASQCIFSPANGTVLNELKTYTISVTYNGLSTSFDVMCMTLPEWDDRGLEYNSWDTIQTYAQFGKLGTVANVGDTKSFVMNNQTYNAAIVSINDGTGDAGQWYPDRTVDFISIELFSENSAFNDGLTNSGGFPASKLRNTLDNTMYPLLPSDLKDVIIGKLHSYQSGSYNSSTSSWDSQLTTISTKLWTPTRFEITGEIHASALGETSVNNKKYTLNSLIKRYYGNANRWWLSSVHSNSNRYVWVCDTSGSISDYSSNNPYYVPICFRIG